MNVQVPTLGPILGYTSNDQARIWLRGDMQQVSGGIRRAFGVVQVREKKSSKWSPPAIQKLEPHFDMTGVHVVRGLKPETDYVYRAGWFFSDAEWETVEKKLVNTWTNFEEIPFRTGSNDSTKPRSFVAGSCRYLLRFLGNNFFDDRGDKNFRSILEQMEKKGIQTDALIMAGDQIYADDLNVFRPDRSIDQYLERYHSVFEQPHMRRLMSRVPTYMILDDHEIEDNWPQNASKKDRVTIYPAAIHAYQIYQASHSPLFALDEDGYISGTPEWFWYSFTDGCVDCFVVDSRTERVWDNDPKKRRIISLAQMEALLRWLDDGSGRVKLIVTSVPVFPDLKTENEDKWGGFQRERTQILDFIRQKKIRKVVILSGDVHCSFTAELSSPADPSFKVISVVSSSFFWPYPHMRESAFAFDTDLASDGGQKYHVSNASEVHSTDNFGRLTFDPNGLEVAFFSRKGEQLGSPIKKVF